uniref:Putative l-carnitine dehydratase/alpha-methylacyl-coa racemase n=1 Tax=Tabanus bromius TaxID=304241 RepID=A0A0K8TKU1_TABBR
MALKGIRVLEFGGLAPGPFCGKVLADFGASVTRIDRTLNNPIDCLQDGKKTLAVNLKNQKSQDLLRSLAKVHDVLIEPYRPGVMEKLHLGPDVLMKDNPKLIYARLTGFGQTGPLSKRAGHDINYIAVSGVLSFLGRKSEKPTAPINLLADFAGGGLLCALGICLALLERSRSGKGQIVDSSMTEGSAYIASWLMMSQGLPIWHGARGENVLDTGSFYYDTYETKDGKFMSVGAIEPQFYESFVKILGLDDLSQFGSNEEAKIAVEKAFKTKTQKEWSEIFEKVDACVFPVVDWNEVDHHHHNKATSAFSRIKKDGYNLLVPIPSPRLSRTPGEAAALTNQKSHYEDAVEILKLIGKTEKDVEKLMQDGTILLSNEAKL